jgi:biopolymer transport protein ExbD
MQIGSPAAIRKAIPLTPLVDIVFLLLMFFMLSSTFTKFGIVELDSAAAKSTSISGAPFPGAIVVIIDDRNVALNGKAVEVKRLAQELDRLHRVGVQRAAIRVGSAATVQGLITVLEAARQSRITDLAVVR